MVFEVLKGRWAFTDASVDAIGRLVLLADFY